MQQTQRNPIEEASDDKSTWGEGPWQNEPDRLEWRDKTTGLPCLILRGPSGALCGYVGVAPGHPLHKVKYDAAYMGKKRRRRDKRLMASISVHGGITYSNGCEGHICHVPRPGETHNVWWLGFDCAHCFDVMPRIAAQLRMAGEIMKAMDPRPCPVNFPEDKYRDVAYVKAECADLAGQLKAMQ